jgi:membrane-bound ClpP family serine protease
MVRGEIWQAELEPAAAPLPAGAMVHVIAIQNLVLIVRRSDSAVTFE